MPKLSTEELDVLQFGRVLHLRNGDLKMPDKIVPLHPKGANAIATEAGGIPVNVPEGLPEIGNLGFEDMEAAFNMRGWLQKACEAAGAKMTGGGFGGGVADIDIELEGHHYGVSIKALNR